MAVWYCGSTKWTAVTAWAASTAYSVGDLRRQLATPTVGNERVFRCTTAGTSGGTEPTWTITKGGTTNDNTCVWTEVTGNSTYGWGAAAARLKLFLNGSSSWAATGDTIYVSNNHAESGTDTKVFRPPVGTTAVTRVLCVNDGAAPPTALATTATVTQPSGGDIYIPEGPGAIYVYGITFDQASSTAGINFGYGASSTLGAYASLEACTFKMSASSATPYVIFGGTQVAQGTSLFLRDCKFVFGHASQQIRLGSAISTVVGGSIAATGTVPTTLFRTSQPGHHTFYGVDVSALGSGKNLLDATNSTVAATLGLVDCKLGASVSLTSGSLATTANVQMTVINSDSSDTVYRYAAVDTVATEQHETTIVRSGGASDGTTTVARKVVTTATCSIVAPYESAPIEFWNTNLSAQTITIPIISSGSLTNADVWLEVEYLGTSGNPLGTIVSGRVSDPIFGTPATHPTDSSSVWASAPSTPVQQSLVSPVFTAAKAGLIRVWVKVAKASTTLYYDPKPVPASTRQYMSEAGFVVEGPPATLFSGGITGDNMLGDFTAGSVFDLRFTTRADGAPTTLTGGTLAVYKANSTTESTTGVTLTADYDGRTGLNSVRIDTTTDPTFYASGNDYSLVLTAGTVNGVSVVGAVVAEFSITHRSADATTTATAVWAAGTRTLTAGTNIALAKGSGITGFNDLSSADVTAAVPSASTIATATAAQVTTDHGAGSYIRNTEPLDAAGVRSAIGLATANLDTQLDTLPTAAETASQVRTELTTELGRIDVAVSSRGTGTALDAAGVRSAIGLASANLDTQIDAIPTAAETATAVAAQVTTDHGSGSYVRNTEPLDAAGVRTAVGLATANLDTQLGDLPTNAELTTALAGADDAVLAAIAALNNLSSAGAQAAAAAALSAYGAATGAQVGAVLTTQMTESYSVDGSAPTAAQALYAVLQRLTEFSITDSTITVKRLDGSTTAFELTLDDASAPTSSTRSA